VALANVVVVDVVDVVVGTGASGSQLTFDVRVAADGEHELKINAATTSVNPPKT
jgi:hypothetical protein